MSDNETERHVEPTPERVISKAIRKVLWNANLVDRDGTSEQQNPIEDQFAAAALTAIEEAGYVINEQKWRDIDDGAKSGKPHLFICRWKDQVGYAEEQIVLRWEIDGWFDWDSVKLNESIPVAYIPLPSPPETSDE